MENTKVGSWQLAVSSAIILGALLILAGCASKKQNLDDVLAKFDELDKKYGTEWKKERIERQMVDLENIDNYLKEVQELQNTQNEKLIQDLVKVRILMLEAQKEFITAQKIDQRPLANFNLEAINGSLKQVLNLTGLSCENKTNVLNALPHYEQSAKKIQEAFILLDDVLQTSKEARQKIGAEKDNRVQFYTFPPSKILTSNKISRFIVQRICKYNVGNK